MADKTGKKTVSMTVNRERVGLPKVVVATGFKLRAEKSTGLIEVLFECYGQKGERVSFDPIMLQGNQDALKKYAVGLAVEPEDTAEREDVPVADYGNYSNIAHFSQMGGRAETIFGVFCLNDWVDATRKIQGGNAEIKSVDVIAAMSSIGLQKKLLLDLLILVTQRGKE